MIAQGTPAFTVESTRKLACQQPAPVGTGDVTGAVCTGRARQSCYCQLAAEGLCALSGSCTLGHSCCAALASRTMLWQHQSVGTLCKCPAPTGRGNFADQGVMRSALRPPQPQDQGARQTKQGQLTCRHWNTAEAVAVAGCTSAASRPFTCRHATGLHGRCGQFHCVPAGGQSGKPMRAKGACASK